MKLAMKQKAMSATVVSAMLCGALLCAPSCSTPPLTEIIVTVDSAFPAGDLDSIRLTIVREETRIVTVDLPDQSVPFTQGLVHRGGSFDVSVTAEGVLGGMVVVTQLVPIERFIEGQTLPVRVLLSPSCINVECEEGSSCMAGTCVSHEGDAGAPDAGTSDGGFFDGGIFDGEPLVDALADGSLDVDYGPGECPDEQTDIEGDFICAADCDDCHLCCRTADCRVTCRSGASCRADADGVNIIAECSPGSTCAIGTKNKQQGSLTARCVQSDCEVDCDGDGPCDVLCDNAECLVDCGDNDDCTLRGCTPENCGRDQYVCGRECP